jgi:hypothetical protein
MTTTVLFNRLTDTERAEIASTFFEGLPASKLDELAADYLIGRARKAQQTIVPSVSNLEPAVTATPSALKAIRRNIGRSVGTRHMRSLRMDSHLYKRIELLQKKYKSYGTIEKALGLYPGAIYLMRRGDLKKGKAVDAIVKATDGMV